MASKEKKEKIIVSPPPEPKPPRSRQYGKVEKGVKKSNKS
jgi:hypothetical protein